MGVSLASHCMVVALIVGFFISECKERSTIKMGGFANE